MHIGNSDEKNLQMSGFVFNFALAKAANHCHKAKAL